jgi:hypothetical protein
LKIRLSHVTNSSSSSFVIGIKEKPDEEMMNNPFVKFGMMSLEKNGQVVTDTESLNKWFLEYTWDDSLEEAFEDEYYKEKYELMLKALNDGYTLICKTVDYDDSEGSLLYHIQKTTKYGDDIVIIEGD